MPTTEPDKSEVPSGPTVLLTGASGYVGGRLLSLLELPSIVLRCLARNPDKFRPLVRSSTEVVRGDVLDQSSLDAALVEGDAAIGGTAKMVQRMAKSKQA